MIIVPALSLSLRNKERLRRLEIDRARGREMSLTIFGTPLSFSLYSWHGFCSDSDKPDRIGVNTKAYYDHFLDKEIKRNL